MADKKPTTGETKPTRLNEADQHEAHLLALKSQNAELAFQNAHLRAQAAAAQVRAMRAAHEAFVKRMASAYAYDPQTQVIDAESGAIVNRTTGA